MLPSAFDSLHAKLRQKLALVWCRPLVPQEEARVLEIPKWPQKLCELLIVANKEGERERVVDFVVELYETVVVGVEVLPFEMDGVDVAVRVGG